MKRPSRQRRMKRIMLVWHVSTLFTTSLNNGTFMRSATAVQVLAPSVRVT